MSRKPLVSFLLILIVALAAQAQQPAAEKASASNPAAQPAASPVSSLNPRQMAELRADILVARKMYEEGIAAYKNLLQDHSRDAGVLNKIGIAYQEMGDQREAGHYYKQATKADHKFASPYNNLGTIEYEQKKYARAVKLYHKALKANGDAATVYSNLGYAYFAQKQYSDAMASFHQALAIDPRVFERHNDMGSIVQQRTMTDPGMFYFFIAKSYAENGDAERCAHYLKLARDDGYTQFVQAQSDPGFVRVIHDQRVQELFHANDPVAN
jgi:tetratricopeptide (TPR) repeat protein